MSTPFPFSDLPHLAGGQLYRLRHLPAGNWVPTTPNALDLAYGKPCKTVTLQAGRKIVLLLDAYQPTVVAGGMAADELITNEDQLNDQPAAPVEDETVTDEMSLPRLLLPLIRQR